MTDISWPLTSCTENEAHRFGRFLAAILEDITRWHDKSVFEKVQNLKKHLALTSIQSLLFLLFQECQGFPGFRTIFRHRSDGPITDQLEFENYRHLCHKWHLSITRVGFQKKKQS